MELNLHIKQSQTLSPQMLQSIKILQMGTQELSEYIEKTVQENPTLEVLMPPEPEQGFSAMRKKLEWLDGADRQEKYSRAKPFERNGELPSDYKTEGIFEETLYDYLFAQLQGLELTPEQTAAVHCIVESLNPAGLLDESLDVLAKAFHTNVRSLREALQIVQQLEPAGVGARSLIESLLLQLQRLDEDTVLAERIVSDHLPLLAKNWYSQMARLLSVSGEEVRKACEQIRSLNPKPGSGFAVREQPHYIVPDLLVEVFPDRMELTSNDRYLPSLQISSYYKSLMAETQDDEVKEYLSGKLQQAQWVMKSIEQRRSTLLRCVECILNWQEPFFRSGTERLRPMKLSDIASRLEIHESTVSRAIKGKYLQCPWGVYPLSHFFMRSLGSASEEQAVITAESVKALLKEMISGEDKRKPFSDQKLCDWLVGKGCPISRRTVAKYRDELGIPPAGGRKVYE